MRPDESGPREPKETPLWLAPMDGVTDFPFRLWMQLLRAPDWATTPFLRVTPGLNWTKTDPLFLPESFCLKGMFRTTVIPQLMGSSAAHVAQVAQSFLPHCESIDLNCGCPAPIVFKHGAGSALLRSPELFSRFLEDLSPMIRGERMSVKMRTGITTHEEFPQLLSVVARFAPRRLFIHPRTRQQGYTGQADWSQVAYALNTVNTPIVGSGDIVDRESFQKKLETAPKLSGVMIGRGALANPWIFADLKGELTTKPESRAVAWAIANLLLCHHMAVNCRTEEVHRFCEVVAQADGCLACPEKLEEVFHRLAEVISPHRSRIVGDIALSPHALPRTKQLVKFLSSTLISSCLRTPLLRATSVGEFLSVLLEENCNYGG